MDQRIEFLTRLNDQLPTNRTESIETPALLPEKSSDAAYLKLRTEILGSNFYITANKHTKIRLCNWIKILDGVKANRVWQSNRDNYAKLLSLMCHCNFLLPPFHQMPPSEDPPNLRKHEINTIFNNIEREIKVSKMTSRRSSRFDSQSYRKLKTDNNIDE